MPRMKASDKDRLQKQEAHEIDAMAAPFRQKGIQDCREGMSCLIPPNLHNNKQASDWWYEGYMAELKRQKDAQKVGAA